MNRDLACFVTLELNILLRANKMETYEMVINAREKIKQGGEKGSVEGDGNFKWGIQGHSLTENATLWLKPEEGQVTSPQVPERKRECGGKGFERKVERWEPRGVRAL